MSHDCLKKLKGDRMRFSQVVLQNGAERIQSMEEIEEETGAGQIQKRESSHVPVFALCQGTQLKFSHTNLN